MDRQCNVPARRSLHHRTGIARGATSSPRYPRYSQAVPGSWRLERLARRETIQAQAERSGGGKPPFGYTAWARERRTRKGRAPVATGAAPIGSEDRFAGAEDREHERGTPPTAPPPGGRAWQAVGPGRRASARILPAKADDRHRNARVASAAGAEQPPQPKGAAERSARGSGSGDRGSAAMPAPMLPAPCCSTPCGSPPAASRLASLDPRASSAP